jgi:hypothetical protein
MKIILVALGLIFLWFFFHREKSHLRLVTFEASNVVVTLALAIIRGLFFGYICYALVAVYGNFGRIETLGDVLTILKARPSQLGGPGVIGVIVGGFICLFALFGPRRPAMPSDVLQGRTISDQRGKKHGPSLGRARTALKGTKR